MLSNCDREDIMNLINREGFDYAIVHQSDFREIEDKEFHSLRRKFINARQELADYLEIDDDSY